MKSYVPYLSLRYLWFHKVSTTLGILGVTLGVGLVIIVVGVMDGFQARLRRSLISNSSAVIVRPHYDVDAEALRAELLRLPGVQEASPVVHGFTIALRGDRRAVHSQGIPCHVLGIDAEPEARVSELERKLHRDGDPSQELLLAGAATPGDPFRTSDEQGARDRRVREAKRGVLVGSKLARALDLRPDGRAAVRMFHLRPRDEDAEPGEKVELTADSELFTVTGVHSPGDFEFGGSILMDRRDALSFYRGGIRREAEEVRLLLDDPDRCDEVRDLVLANAESIVAASLRKGADLPLLGAPLEATTWKEEHREVLAAVANERGLLLVITSFSFLVVAFLIGSTQSMLVVEKTREIGVLRSLGASVAGTSSVFLGNGFFIGTFGALAGWGLGAAITANIQGISDWLKASFGLNLFPENIYRFDRIPIDVKPEFVAMVIAGAIAFALLGSLLPAVRAASLDPVESLHHE